MEGCQWEESEILANGLLLKWHKGGSRLRFGIRWTWIAKPTYGISVSTLCTGQKEGPCYCQESLSIVGTDALAMEAVPEQKNHTTLLGCVNVQCLISAKCSYPKKVSFTAVMNVKQSTVAMYHRLAGWYYPVPSAIRRHIIHNFSLFSCSKAGFANLDKNGQLP